MAHARKQIRAAVVTALGGLTLTKTNVFASRVRPLAEDQLPALRIYTNDEGDVEPLSIGNPVLQQRTLSLVVECVDKASDAMDDTLDDIAEDVEVALTADVTLGGIARDINYQGTEIEINDESDQPVGVARMRFDVAYIVYDNAPGTPV
jgi:hypothetical protein